MINVILKVFSLRLGIFIFVIAIFPLLQAGQSKYVSNTISVFLVVCAYALQSLVNQLYRRRPRFCTFIQLFGNVISLFILSRGVVSVVSDENAEVLIFANLINIYTCFIDETGCFLKFLILMLVAVKRRYGLIKPVLYITYLTINAFGLLWIICNIVPKIYTSNKPKLTILNRENFIYENLNSFKSAIERRPALYDNVTVYYNYELHDIRQFNLCPSQTRNVRYLGEDIHLKCCVGIKLNTQHKLSFYWTRNGERILNTTDRIHQENSSIVWHGAKNIARIDLMLTIKFLQAEDFGLYHCVREKNVGFPEKIQSHITTNQSYVTKAYLEEFNVLRAGETLDSHRIPLGNIVYMRLFTHFSLAEQDEISFEYRINGNGIHEICYSNFGSCSVSTLLYAGLVLGGVYTSKVSILEFDFDGNLLSFVDVHMCACGRFYGEHTLTLYIPYFNTTTGREEIVEIMHEQRIVVQPFDWLINSSAVFEKFLANTSLAKSSFAEAVTEMILSHQEICLVLVNTVSYIIVFGLLWKAMDIYNSILSLYCWWTVIPVKHVLFPRQQSLGINNAPTQAIAGLVDSSTIEYDIYVSYSEEDRLWTENVILPFLENECGLKVCFSDRDLIANAGKTKLNVYFDAIQSSKKIVIIVSTSYLNDPECNELQLSTCILPLINDVKRTERDIVFIKRSYGITIPIPLKWNMNIHTVDWTSDTHERTNKIYLKRFLNV